MKVPTLKKIEKTKPTKSNNKEVSLDEGYDDRPTFRISAEHLPEIKSWSPGKKYKLYIEAEMTGSQIEDYGSKKGSLEGTFKLVGIAPEEKGNEDYPEGMRVKKK